MKDKKKLIIRFLRKYGRSSTHRIAGVIKSNHEWTLKYLDELEYEDKLIKEVETNSTYWSLR